MDFFCMNVFFSKIYISFPDTPLDTLYKKSILTSSTMQVLIGQFPSSAPVKSISKTLWSPQHFLLLSVTISPAILLAYHHLQFYTFHILSLNLFVTRFLLFLF